MGLQETMIADCEDSLLRKFDPNQEYLWMWNPSKGKSGGIIVGALLERFDVGSFKQGELKIKWNVLVVYGAAQDENKIIFLAELSRFCASNSEPMVIGGDFNIIRNPSEKKIRDTVIDEHFCLTLLLKP